MCAQGGIRTPTPHGTTPSRWRVYQFHHLRKLNQIESIVKLKTVQEV